MLNLDPAKLLVILVVALIVLGPERLPRVARQLGSAWHELTRLREQVTDEVRSAFPIDEIPRLPNASRSISSFVSGLTTPDMSATGPSSIPTPGGVDDASADIGDEAPVRRPPQVVIHPALGDFAFVPDDPSMN